MPRYSVSIRGVNFLVRTDGEPKRLGFHTTRYVEAPDRAAAEDAAVTMLRGTESLREIVLNGRNDPPMLYAEEINELDPAFDDPARPQPGLTWFPMTSA